MYARVSLLPRHLNPTIPHASLRVSCHQLQLFYKASTSSTVTHHRQFASSITSVRSKNMTTEPSTATISSPPAKRVKTDTESSNMTAPAAEPALQVKKLSPQGRLPTRGSEFAAGYDIYAAKDTTVPARGKVLVDTDISIAVPVGTCKFKMPE